MAEEGNNSNRKVLTWVVAVFLVALIGFLVGVVIVKMQKNEPKEEVVVDVMQVLADVNNEIMPMSTEESVEYIDKKVFEYSNNMELVNRLVIMKMNVFFNGNQPAEAIEAAVEANEGTMLDTIKSDYYMILSKAYRAIGNDELATVYKDKFFVLYDEIYDGGGGGE